MAFAESLATVAPVYNLVFVVAVIGLFLKLFSLKNKGVYLTPWKFLYGAVLIYVVEELLTVLDKAGILLRPRILNVFFELAIISIFIYLLLLQKQSLEHGK
ncbi:hypothetical protein J4419_05510 [Candidatus Woesearchaeota archaeon]|nr:hypothetical protein [Candidatus Woesearchaeota archaeon]